MTAPTKPHNRPLPVLLAIIIGGLITLAAIAGFVDSINGTDPTEQAEDTCRAYVQHHLKAPSTAEFSTLTAVTPDTEPDTRVISGYVDSQNGFGAQIRTQFTCTIKHGTVANFWSRP